MSPCATKGWAEETICSEFFEATILLVPLNKVMFASTSLLHPITFEGHEILSPSHGTCKAGFRGK